MIDGLKNSILVETVPRPPPPLFIFFNMMINYPSNANGRCKHCACPQLINPPASSTGTRHHAGRHQDVQPLRVCVSRAEAHGIKGTMVVVYGRRQDGGFAHMQFLTQFSCYPHERAFGLFLTASGIGE
jgi:hypothetical protein